MRMRRFLKRPAARTTLFGLAAWLVVGTGGLVAPAAAGTSAGAAVGNRTVAEPSATAARPSRSLSPAAAPEPRSLNGRGGPRPAGAPSEPVEVIAALKAEARALIARAQADFPDDPDALVLAGNAHYWLGEREEAVRCWGEAARQAPGRADLLGAMSRVALQKGRHAEAADLARRAREAAPQVPGPRRTEAAALMHLGRPAEALPLLEAEVRLVPGDLEARYLLGQALFQLGRYAEAQRHYEAVLSARPDHKNACYGMVRVCTLLGQHERARLYRERFRDIQKKDLDGLIEETRSFDDAATTRRHLAGTATEAGLLYARHDRRKEAERLWHRAADLDARAVVPRVRLADLYTRAGRLDEALAVLRELRTLEPENPAHLVSLGVVHMRRRAWREAEQAFREARRVAPRRALGHRALAQFYLSRGQNPQRALELARWAVGLEPTAVNYFVLARALDATGDRAGAVRAIRRAVHLDPTNPVYRNIYERIRPKS